MPSSAIYLALYETMHAQWKEWHGIDANTQRGIKETFAFGFLAATVTTILTNPFDVTKTRVQVPSTLSGIKEAPGLTGCFRVLGHVYRSEGMRGLMNGLTLRILRRPLSQAIVWSVVEWSRRGREQEQP